MMLDSANSVFVNLSNHPTSSWSVEQLSEAMKYGRVVDMAFPQIAAGDDEDSVRSIASKYVEMLLDSYCVAGLTVHVMGEMTFTFAVVEKLKSLGVRCLASTTERTAEELPDGRKVSQFKFVRFRCY